MNASRAYWFCQAGGWLLMAALAITFNAGQSADVLRRVAGVYLWAGGVGIFLTHGWRGWLRRTGVLEAPGVEPKLRMAPPLLLLAVAMACSTATGFRMFQPFGPVAGYAWLPGATLSWIGVLSVWTLIYAQAVSVRRQRRLSEDALRHKAQAQQAELRALQAKVNPHFFFNSLNSLRALVFEDQQAAARMIDQIAALMRHSLGASGQHTVPLADELAAVRAYLAIEQIRFEERLRVSIDVAPDLLDLAIPPMTLQTLVENAVKYGVEPNPAGSDVRIRARRTGAGVELSVANQGAIATGSASTRIGLDNVRERLALVRPGRSTVTLLEAGGWVTAAIVLEEP